MNLGISVEEFESYSKEKKKKYIAKLLITESNAQPVHISNIPIAIVMAGLPGAGKTEFLDSLDEILKQKDFFGSFVRIDLDQIVTIYPKYTPKSYDKFRSQGNHAIARCIDVARSGRYNLMIDGTFSGSSGASINNIDRLLHDGYMVFMFYMHDNPATAWGYTKAREVETKRGISKDDFIASYINIYSNLKKAISKFGNVPSFEISVVVQKELRDKDYNIISDRLAVEEIIKKSYNIDELRKRL